MADYRRPCHDERLAPCPICGGEPWADSKNGTIYCDCGLRYHMNGECHPEWHRMDWTADEWNRLANAKAENAKLRVLVYSILKCSDEIDRDKGCDVCPMNTDGDLESYLDGTWCKLRSTLREVGFEVE